VEQLNRSGEQNRHVDTADPLGDRAHHVKRGVIARHIDPVLAVRLKQEADHRPGDVVGPVGAVLGRERRSR
jgi:hypothetical protein